jgi:hypothetical protein
MYSSDAAIECSRDLRRLDAVAADRDADPRHIERGASDDGCPAQGLMWGMVFSTPIWGLILLAFSWL